MSTTEFPTNFPTNRLKQHKIRRDARARESMKLVAPQGLEGIKQHDKAPHKTSCSFLVRMRSPVQIWIAAPRNSWNRRISGVFVLFSLKIMWVKKWVRQDDPQLDPHGEMSGKVSRAPGRKFGFPARCFWRWWVDFYIIWVIKFPMVSAAWSCICRVAWV